MTEKEIERKRKTDVVFAEAVNRAEEISNSAEEIYSRRKERRIASLAVLAACAVVAFYFIIQRWDEVATTINTLTSVITPFIVGFVMAFFMNPIMVPIEKVIRKPLNRLCKTTEKAKKAARLIATLLSLVIFLGIIALFFVIIVPSTIETLGYLSTHIEASAERALDWVDNATRGMFTAQIDLLRLGDVQQIVSEIYDNLKGYVNIDNSSIMATITTIWSSVYGVGRTLAYIIVGIIVSVYVVQSKEVFKAQSKKLLYAFFKIDNANLILEVGRKTKDIFYGFIIGKIIDSLIIGVICYIVMLILQLPYPVLISVIIGLTNIIPVFGPYFGAIPSFILIFLTDPMKGLVFVIMILVLQQIDGNIIGPKILGESTGLSAFWVVVAIIVGGGLFGFVGMIIGVPVTAMIYYGVGRFSRYLLAKKGLPIESADYRHLEKITDDGQIEFIDYQQRLQKKKESPLKKDLFAKFKNNKKANK